MPSTSTPMLRALPAIVRTAASRSAAVRSGILVFAISSACARVSLPTLSVCGFALPFSSFSALRDQHRGGRRLDDEREALVRERGDHHRQHQARLHLLGLRVERLAELHDVQAALAERGTDGRRRIRLARRHLQLDEADDLLCHDHISLGASGRPSGALPVTGRDPPGRGGPRRYARPGKSSALQAFSTCPKSSSTGVARPKISTDTRILLFS